MKRRYEDISDKVFNLCKARSQGTVSADVTQALGVPAKYASDCLNQLATRREVLRRVAIPNSPRARYRYFAYDKAADRRNREAWGMYDGTPIEQMPIIKIKQGAQAQ